jgi:hypothetical protein
MTEEPISWLVLGDGARLSSSYTIWRGEAPGRDLTTHPVQVQMSSVQRYIGPQRMYRLIHYRPKVQ